MRKYLTIRMLELSKLKLYQSMAQFHIYHCEFQWLKDFFFISIDKFIPV